MDPSPESRPDTGLAPTSERAAHVPEGAMPQTARALDTVPAGQGATIARMENGDHPMIARVKAMGLFPGSRVRVVRQGQRLVLSGERVRIALSRSICSHIQVLVDDAAGARP